MLLPLIIITIVHAASANVTTANALLHPSPTSMSSSSPPPFRRLSHHKVNPMNAVALIDGMDEWAPYRMVCLLLLVAFSVAIWVSYKILCESEHREEVAYQPLNSLLIGNGSSNSGGFPLLMRQMEEEDEELTEDEEAQQGFRIANKW